jgi:hypothetical protein
MSKEKKLGKIVYIPPERCLNNVEIEETPHGFKVYQKGENRPFKVLPLSVVREVSYTEGRA